MSIFVFVMLTCVSQDSAVSGPQFEGLLRSEHAKIRDVACIFEGKSRWVGPAAVLKGDPNRFGTEFQGTYLYRSDRAELLDVYAREVADPLSLSHRKEAILGNRYETLRMTPDMKRPDRGPFIESTNVKSPSISDPYSPQQLLYLSFFRQCPGADAWGYEFEGWENIDGQNCLKTRFRFGTGPDPPYSIRFWTDMGREGHPLKVEHYHGSRLWLRTRVTELLQCSPPGKPGVWLPIRCESEGFQWAGKYYDTPMHQKTTSIVYTGIMVNVGLPDALFTVRGEGRLPDLDKFATLRREKAALPLEQAFNHTPAFPLPRNDPASVRRILNEQLAIAEKQATTLDASSPSSQGVIWQLVLQGTFVFLGVGALLGAVFLRRRR
jgi:hypothetical protein